MDPLTIAAIGSAAVGAGSSIFGGLSAKKKESSALNSQARLTYLGRQREIDMLRRENQQEQGAARAAIGASNLLFTGTPQRYMEALNYDNLREIGYAEYAAKRERRAIRKGGSGLGQSMITGGIADAASSALSLYSQGYFSQPGGTVLPSMKGQPFGSGIDMSDGL